MQSFEWLKTKEGKAKENFKNKSRNFPFISELSDEKRMYDICLLVNAGMSLEWPVHSVNLAAAKLHYLG